MIIKKIAFLLSLNLFFITILFAQDESRLMQAKEYYFSGEYKKAVIIYESLYSNKQFKELVYENYLNSLFKLKEYNEAEKIIRKRIKEDGNKLEFLFDLALTYQEKGIPAEADKIYNDIIKNLKPDIFYINEIASQFFNINNYQLALKTFLQGRKLLNDENQFAAELVNLYRYERNKEGVTRESLKLVALNPAYLGITKSTILRTYEVNSDYHILKSAILRDIQKNPQNIELIDLLAWTFLQLKDYDMALIQTIALDKRTNDNGAHVYALSNVFLNNLAYSAAEKGFNYLTEKGKENPYFIPAKINLLKIKNKQLIVEKPNTSSLLELEKDYSLLIAELGTSPQSLFAIIELSKLKAYHLNKSVEAENILEKALDIKGLSLENLSYIKLDLADIYILNKNFWDASLMLGQVEKSFPNTPIGQEAKFKNAKISFYNGDFKWAKSQLDVLKASTSQLIANDALDLSLLIQDNLFEDSSGTALKIYARAEFLRFINKNDEALNTLDSIKNNYSSNALVDDVLLSKAKIYNSQNKTNLAIEAYEEILAHHSQSIWVDDALYSLGILYQDNLADKEKALHYFQKLIEDYPGSLFVIDARNRFRALRGDAL